MWVSIHLSIYLPTYLSIYLSIYLSPALFLEPACFAGDDAAIDLAVPPASAGGALRAREHQCTNDLDLSNAGSGKHKSSLAAFRYLAAAGLQCQNWGKQRATFSLCCKSRAAETTSTTASARIIPREHTSAIGSMRKYGGSAC